jgi:hypothetical protein
MAKICTSCETLPHFLSPVKMNQSNDNEPAMQYRHPSGDTFNKPLVTETIAQ